MNKSKVLTTSLSVATLSLALSACSGGSSGSPESSAESGNADSGDVTTVSVMTWESAETNQLIDQKIAEMWDNPSIIIERIDAPSGDYGDKLGSLAQAKQLPDLFWCGNDTAQQYSQLGILTDWSNHMGGDFTAEDFGGLDSWTSENGIGGLPALQNVFGVWYNADLFHEAGLPLPEPGWTWDDMYTAAEGLIGAGGANYPLTSDMFVTNDGPFAMGMYAVSAGGSAFTDDVHAPTEVQMDAQYREGVEKLRNAIAEGLVAPPDYDVANTASLFAAGQQPMMIGGQWQAQSFSQDAGDIDWGWAPLPHQGEQTTLYDAIGMCTPASTPHQDQTFEVLKFMNTDVLPAVMAETPVAPTAYIPGRQGYFDSLTEMGADTVLETLEYSLASPNGVNLRFTTPWASQANDLTVRDYLPVLKNEKDMSELDVYVEEVQRLIDEHK